MLKSRIFRIALIGLCTASVLFIVAIVIGGGSNTVALETPTTKAPTAKIAAAAPPKNLTKIVTDRVVERLTAPTEKTTAQVTPPTPGEVADSAVIAAARAFDVDDLLPLIKSSSFIIASDNSTAAKRAYLSELAVVMQKAGGLLPPSKDDPATPDFTVGLERYTTALGELLALPVPRNFLSIHRQAVDIVGMQKNIFAILKNYKADPIQAYLAAQSETVVLGNLESFHADINLYLTPPSDES